MDKSAGGVWSRLGQQLKLHATERCLDRRVHRFHLIYRRGLFANCDLLNLDAVGCYARRARRRC